MHLFGSSLPLTFGIDSEAILIEACNTKASQIHLVFDRYFYLSSKDCRRENHCETDVPFVIVGPQQTRAYDFFKSLKNRRFKEPLVQFLSDHWDNYYAAQIVVGEGVFITSDEYCYSYQAVDNRMIKINKESFKCFMKKRTQESYFILQILRGWLDDSFFSLPLFLP